MFLYAKKRIKEEMTMKLEKVNNDKQLTSAIHALLRAGYKTWEDVNKANIEDLLKVRCFGKRSLVLIMEQMDRFGI